MTLNNTDTHSEQAIQALEKYFGYKSFRPLQAEVIEKVCQGEDVVLLMPTGGGKSICYQIPALTLPGTAIVVSPLISLMKDQVDGLKANGVRAEFYNSSQSSSAQQAVEEALFQGNLDMLYVSPEKLVSQSFLPLLRRVQINLFAIDEAHCISSWGHDFRPEYTKLQFLKSQFPQVPIIALTATADKVTRKDIKAQLSIPEAETFVASFDRPNLRLQVLPGQMRLQQILDFIHASPKQSGIIYCLSRKSTERLSAQLLSKGYKAAAYHAGLDARTRSRVQKDFSDDRVPIVCATIAFGMGIDKSNVRWVIHYNLPKNIESYYQEIGRAGRDGAAANAVLFYSYQDVRMLHDMLSENESEVRELKLEKLERMQQFAETAICRRRMLLNYFSETYSKPKCNNCDVCLNPPTYMDGTKLAQMALSAVYRMKEQVGIQLLVGVLRGSARKQILEKGYDKIKTYGVGRHYSEMAWQHYIRQMINIGLLDIAYDAYNVLRLTPASQKVLFEGETVSLVEFSFKKKESKKEKKREQVRQRRDYLFEKLRELRTKIARAEGVPPYRVFSDASLQEMAEQQPITYAEFHEINGVGQQKMASYGERFLGSIREYLLDQSRQGNKVKRSTYLYSLELFNQGLSPTEVANERQLATGTILSHLLQMVRGGESLNFKPYLPKGILDDVRQQLPDRQEPETTTALFQAMDEKWTFDEIRMALIELNRQGFFE